MHFYALQYGSRVLERKKVNIGSYGAMKGRLHLQICCRVKSSLTMLVPLFILSQLYTSSNVYIAEIVTKLET